MSELDLCTLDTGIPALTPKRAGVHMEACVWCLLECGHSNGVTLKVFEKEKNEDSSYQIVWIENQIDKSALCRAYNRDDGADDGAVAIALLLIREKTNYKAITRSVIGTGFDYWLGYKDIETDQIIGKESARLEISGILKENIYNKINKRVNNKIKQTKQSDDTSFPAYIIVVEFSQPKAEMVLRNVKS